MYRVPRVIGEAPCSNEPGKRTCDARAEHRRDLGAVPARSLRARRVASGGSVEGEAEAREVRAAARVPTSAAEMFAETTRRPKWYGEGVSSHSLGSLSAMVNDSRDWSECFDSDDCAPACHGEARRSASDLGERSP